MCGEDSTREREREGEELVFVPSQSLRQWQHQMAVLLRQQKERGGVIDLTAKDDVIDLSWVGVTCTLQFKYHIPGSFSVR